MKPVAASDAPDTARAGMRKQLRANRRALSVAEQRIAARNLLHNVLRLAEIRSARHIALYWPNDGEIDPRPLLKRLKRMRKQCFVPLLSELFHNRLWFVPVGARTRRNLFGIPEPIVPARARRSGRELDLVFLPLVGFDRRGNRIGMGGGFYDRTFGFLRDRDGWHRPTLIGLAHACQEVPALQPAEWDVPLAAIVTDREIIRP
jgi:5-formyltetrahydrofolate cyclo-ligase